MVSKIIETHRRMRAREETLFLAVYVMDAFLSKCTLNRHSLHQFLLSVLFIAAKYEETTYVRFSKILDAYNYQYKMDLGRVVDMEAVVLDQLNFRLNTVCPYDFLKRIFLIHKCENKDLSQLISGLQFLHFGGAAFLRHVPFLEELGKGVGCF